MEVTRLSDRSDYQEYILGGDIGGSNTNLAIVGRKGESYDTLVKYRFESKDVDEFSEVIQETLDHVAAFNSALLPDKACICAAGPIKDNWCKPTNLEWEIDGPALQDRFSIKFSVMNDFQAICYGVPLLDVNDDNQVICVPHTDGSMPAATGGARAVAGAGTGLGVGFITRIGDALVSIPSEGGHTGFAPFDDESEGLFRYVADRYDTAPGTEVFLSGRGMTEIFKYFRDVKKVRLDGALADINEVEDADKPPVITKNTPTDPGCQEIMKLFIRIYGHFAARTSLFFLPRAGMYIAGGIVARHSWLFLKEHNFMMAYEKSYNPVMESVLKSIPVYIVNDYAISLRGAAHAAVAAERDGA